MGRIAKAAVAREQQARMDDSKRTQRTQLLHDLELQHQQNGFESDILIKDEDLRRLQVRILLLRDENNTLRDQVDLNTNTNAKLVSRCDNLNTQIEAKIAIVRSQEEQLRKQERDYSTLQAELESMNNLNETSANILSEKLALTRELANLKPEIEHLRSQVNHQQTILAEKLSLERQVNTLEVELANEKKATKRAFQTRESNDRVEDELRKKLRETEKNLTAEIAERERLQDQLEQRIRTHAITLQDQDNNRELEADLRKKLQDAQRQLREEKEERERLNEELQNAQRASKKSQQAENHSPAEAELSALLEESESRVAILKEEGRRRRHEYERSIAEYETAVAELEERNGLFEKKLEKAKIKFRETQEALKKSQAELRKAQQQQARSSNNEDNTKVGAKSQAFRKRKAQETTSEFTNIEIQTPSADDAIKARRAMKKAVFEPTVVGEKSTFSITPFLNRSKNTSMSDEASNVDEGVLEDSILGPQPERELSEHTPSGAVDDSANTSVESEPVTTVPKETKEPQVVPKVRGRPKKVLGDAPSAKKNALAKKPAKKILKTKSSLEVVSEAVESGEGEKDADAREGEPAEKTTTVKFNLAVPQDESINSSLNGEIPKKKKRKVLGSTKTLFDEDDGEVPAARKPAKAQLGVKRTKAPLGGGQKNAFAGTKSFSPLKRDRRGVGASFLA
ncbi:hypothetical protein ONZ43_g611 [Nemania bipapillata]|uniref:Uncharacterized protein n=1 Tax=Nemania bipapillata TaxID=110536 RepID=A0ACC2J7E8_9PEZI|nr:hypothetical protein ONZ43_g611 [Nemania bipapillata]